MQLREDWQMSHHKDINGWRLHPVSSVPVYLGILVAQVNRLTEHADSFMDVPRLSTLQGMLIVLKARESAPKRGYYFRSWMTVVACVQMAKDLGLDEHFDEHKAGRPCGSDLADCITKTRIWQTVFACELMVGSPQGLPSHSNPITGPG